MRLNGTNDASPEDKKLNGSLRDSPYGCTVTEMKFFSTFEFPFRYWRTVAAKVV